MAEFDSFYYNGRIVELADALTASEDDLKACYSKDNLYCPECAAAKLKFTMKTGKHKAFLSTKPSTAAYRNDHVNCSHIYERATKAQVCRYYDALDNSQIKDKLNAAINRYLLNGSKNPGAGGGGNANPAIAAINGSGSRTFRRLPTKSLYSIYKVNESEYDIPILIYGDAVLKIESVPSLYRKDDIYYRLNIISTRTGNRMRYFNFNRTDFLWDGFVNGSRAHIAMIVKYTKGDVDSDVDTKIKLYSPQSIVCVRKE